MWCSVTALTGCFVRAPAPDPNGNHTLDAAFAAENRATLLRNIPQDGEPAERDPVDAGRPDGAMTLHVARSPEDAEDQLSKFGHHWFYGPGLGQTMANVGTVIVFPPWAIYLLGNAGLAVAGYEPVSLTSLLPDGPRRYVDGAYGGVVSVPGRITAAVAGERYDGPAPPAGEKQE